MPTQKYNVIIPADMKPRPKAHEESAVDSAAANTPSIVDDITIQPIKPSINIDVFKQLDLRVCEIVKCQEIRKSNNCLKLTLNDGLYNRVIVSSISHDYAAEELVGKKIIVVANLESARITGVTSEGMLLAATGDNGKCTVIFVDKSIPNGAMLS